MSEPAAALARWAADLEPAPRDEELARRSLLDTLAVMLAAREDPIRRHLGPLSDAGRWSALAHVLDFDDLHMPSTAHLSAVCVPVALACGGGGRAYLAGAGVMARLGSALGWRHYRAGWHSSTTAGAPAAAVAAAVSMGLDAETIATAIALAVPAAGGVQRSFGTQGKSLQVAFAAEAGVRAARLAASGARADVRALEQWIALVGGDPADPHLVTELYAGPGSESVIPGGLAVKLHPCCYALQRPIAAVLELGPIPAAEVRGIRVSTLQSTLAPLRHAAPETGLEAKFSLPYSIAAALLDGRPGLASFTDLAVRRPQARRLMECVEVETLVGGDGLLDGDLKLEVELGTATHRTVLSLPPGAPGRPPSDAELLQKLRACVGEGAAALAELSWESAADHLRALL